jgi:predicted Zn-dependent protease
MRRESRNLPGLAEALPELVSSLGADPTPRNVMKVAEALWLAREPVQAIALLEPLLTKDEAAISPRVLLAWCYEDASRESEAARARETVHRLDPANPYGRSPEAEGNGGEELTAVGEASASARPSPAPAGEEIAAPSWEGLEKQAEPETALSPEELREIPPGPLYSVTLAEIFAKQGFGEKAIEIYREILRAHPDREDLASRIRELLTRSPGDSP